MHTLELEAGMQEIAEARITSVQRVNVLDAGAQYVPVTGLTKTRTGPDPRTGLNSRKSRARRARMPGLHVCL